jgi:hypothetical protein
MRASAKPNLYDSHDSNDFKHFLNTNGLFLGAGNKKLCSPLLKFFMELLLNLITERAQNASQ